MEVQTNVNFNLELSKSKFNKISSRKGLCEKYTTRINFKYILTKTRKFVRVLLQPKINA